MQTVKIQSKKAATTFKRQWKTRPKDGCSLRVAGMVPPCIRIIGRTSTTRLEPAVLLTKAVWRLETVRHCDPAPAPCQGSTQRKLRLTSPHRVDGALHF